MRIKLAAIGLAGAAALTVFPAAAQTAFNAPVLSGLAPLAALPNTETGKAALTANYSVTGAIQSGALRQPLLMMFADQQIQALKDAYITGWNVTELADALGTKLGAIYQDRARYEPDGKFTSISPAVAKLIAYTNETTGLDSNAAKYFFANGTTDGKTPVPASVASLLTAAGGVTDVFGKAYDRVGGSPGADPFGNSRPFQTEPTVTLINGDDYFGSPSSNTAYLRGPAQNLTESPSYPSGHTTYGTMGSLLLAILVPERYGQQITRAAEYGNDRIILGAHYAMDVIAGRTLAFYDVAHLLANDPAYVGQPKRFGAVITDYPAAVQAARSELREILQSACGDTVTACAAADTSRFANSEANEALVESTLTYGLPTVHANTANTTEDVAKLAPEAGYLLTAAFPYLTMQQADDLLTVTEGPGGGFLDNGSGFGVYSRLNLYLAGQRAAALAPNDQKK